MNIEISRQTLSLLNPQSLERTAERMTYNSADLLKMFVHREVEIREHTNEIRAALRAQIADVDNKAAFLPPGYNAEAKLAIAHVLVSTYLLIEQLCISDWEIEDLIIEVIKDHRGEW